MNQKVDNWIELTPEAKNFHDSQFSIPHRNTVFFVEWLISKGLFTKEKMNYLDVGCGKGGSIFYLNQQVSNNEYTGIDVNSELISSGNSVFQEKNLTNCKLLVRNLYEENKDLEKKFDCVLSFQTLSYLPECIVPIKQMSKMAKSWVACSSLFFDGELNCTVNIEDNNQPLSNGLPNNLFYNVYSLSKVRKCFKECGFSKFSFIPFEIDVDLEKTNPRGKGSFTKKLESGKRIIFSGPLHMPWHFILAER